MRFLLAPLLLLAGAAQAAPLSDPYSGNTVDPPPGWTATPEATAAGQPYIRLSPENDSGTTCIVRFTPTASYNGRGQDELNAMVGSDAWRGAMTTYLGDTFASRGFSVLSKDTTQANGTATFVVVGAMRAEGSASGPSDTRLWWAAQARPSGLTTTSCTTDAANFPARVTEFYLLVRGMTLR